MPFTEQLTQALSVPVATVPPANVASNNTTPTSTGAVDMLPFKRILGLVNVGVQTAATNVSVFFTGCNTSNGTFTNISSPVATTLTNSNGLITVEIRSDQLPTGNRFVKLAALVSGGANTGAFLSMEVLGGEAHHKPASQQDVANSNTFSLTRAVSTL